MQSLYLKVAKNHVVYMLVHHLVLYTLFVIAIIRVPYAFGAAVCLYCLLAREVWGLVAVALALALYAVGIIGIPVLLALFGLSLVVNPILIDKIGTLFGYILTNTAYEIERRFAPRPPRELPLLERARPRVSLILCNKNETPDHLARCLETLQRSRDLAETELNLPRMRLVLCDGGSDNLDPAFLEQQVDAIHVRTAGKLEGRDFVTRVESCDIIIAVDSDKRYTETAIRDLLAPMLASPDVVSSSADEWELPFGFGIRHFRMNGGCSAYFKAVYLLIPFDLATNQRRYRDIWYEEEFRFLYAMRGFGRIHHFRERNVDQRPVSLAVIIKRHLGFSNVGKGF
jgi:hypothetical protein